jgi:predicted patatin/cPLA2 family phospholipase
LEVKAEDVHAMMAAIKSNVSPGNFVPFHMQSANAVAFEKAASYVASKNANTWSFLINYVSEGSFFKLENNVKQALLIDHVIYNPVNKTMKVLIVKKLIDQSQEIIRHSL